MTEQLPIGFAYPSPWLFPIEGQPALFDYVPRQGCTLVADPLDPKAAAASLLEYAHRVRYFLPLSEEGVLPCAIANTNGKLPGLSLAAALNCTYRLFQRQALDSAGLNPPWRPLSALQPLAVPGARYLKAPASYLNLGVQRVASRKGVARAEAAVRARAAEPCWRLAQIHDGYSECIVEAEVKGDAIEVTGLVDQGGVLRVTSVLEQDWLGDGRIARYAHATGCDGVLTAAARAVAALQLRATICNMEFRKTAPQRYVLIEAHARPGEDGGDYPQLALRGLLRLAERYC